MQCDQHWFTIYRKQETKEHDRIEFLRLCEENLPVEPLVADASCLRMIGKNRTLPWRRLFRLHGSESAADTAITLAIQRHVANSIHQPNAVKLTFEARKLRRANKQQLQQNARQSAGESEQFRSDVPYMLLEMR